MYTSLGIWRPECGSVIAHFVAPVASGVGGETDPSFAERSAADRAFAETWQAAERVVYSRTLEQTSTARTRLERHFDPDAVRELNRTASADLSVSGPDLAAHALRAGLVDELHVHVVPAVVGGGVPYLPGVRLGLTLAEHQRFASGFVYLRYDIDQVTPTVVNDRVIDSHD